MAVWIVGFVVLIALADGQSTDSPCQPGDIQCADGRCFPQSASNLCLMPRVDLESTQSMTVEPGSTQSVTGQALMSSQAVQTTTAKACGMGLVQCNDGRCEPYASLCDDTGYVTQTPMVTIASVKTVGTPFVTTTTTTKRTQGTVPPLVTSPASGMTPASSAVPASTSTLTNSTSTSNTCHEGYVLCKDGRCEPYASLCGDTGFVKYTPLVTVPSVVTGSSGSPGVSNTVDVTTLQPTSTKTMTIVTDSTGQEVCPSGWERCNDGVCEPFHWLCTEHDGTVTTSPAPPSTQQPASTTATATPGSAATAASIGTSVVSGVVVTVTPPASVSPSNNDGCPAGWERCNDGDCEPFHWLCAEHGGSNITLPTPGTLPPSTTPGTGSTMVVTGMSSTEGTTHGVTTTTTTQGTTTTTLGTTVVVTTDASGSCHAGWYQCPDGACEAYAALCDDHAPVVG